MQKFKFLALAILAMLSVNFVWGADCTGTFFTETFDDCAGKGGNDNSWSGSIAQGTFESDNTWTVANAYGADKCAKFGTSSNKGTAKTPALGCSATKATLTFKAGAWNGGSESTTLNLSITGGGTLSQSSVTLTKGAWKTYTITLNNIVATTQIEFAGKNNSNSRFFLDEITIEAEAAATPTITKTANLTNFTYEVGSGPSAAQSFTVGGSNLTANITVTAPTNFEVSKSSGSGYASSVTLTQSSGTVSNTTIYVRMKSGLSQGTGKGGNISLTSTGATTQTIAVVGTVTAPVVKYTVTLLNNGSPVNKGGFDAQGQKQYNSGAALGDLPTLTSAEACDEHSNHFMGWYAGEQPIRTKQPEAPTMVTSSTPVNGDMTLRAVWAKEQ